jgi:hypothetical protein
MPDYSKPSGRDLTDNILTRLSDAEKKIRRLETAAKRSSFDRGDTAAIPAPMEGQTMIQYDSEAAKYYSGGAWRSFSGTSSASTEQSASPIVLPVLSPMPAYTDNSNFQWAKANTVSPTGGIFSNRYNNFGNARTPTVNDYYTWPVNLGPEGSVWALHVHTLQGPDCGTWQPSMASIVYPDPGRSVGDELGTFDSYGGGTYRTTGGAFSDYIAAQTQGFGTKAMAFRLMGAAGDQWTANTGTDSGTGVTLINGGPGPYVLKIQVTTKSASSSGYALDICAITFWRLDDSGLL